MSQVFIGYIYLSIIYYFWRIASVRYSYLCGGMDIYIYYIILLQGCICLSIAALDKKGMELIEAQDVAGIIYMEVWIVEEK